MPAAAVGLNFSQFFLIVVLVAGMSMWVYWHASKQRSQRATAWGVATFLSGGLALAVYLIHHYSTRRRF